MRFAAPLLSTCADTWQSVAVGFSADERSVSVKCNDDLGTLPVLIGLRFMMHAPSYYGLSPPH